jgi:lysine 2,3-aminomutase
MERLAPAFAWLRAHPEVRDVIVSGGDPLVMRTERLTEILGALAAIESLDTVRVATRAPVTLPQRVTDELCAALRTHPAVWLMTHFNHPKELAPAALRAELEHFTDCISSRATPRSCGRNGLDVIRVLERAAAPPA